MTTELLDTLIAQSIMATAPVHQRRPSRSMTCPQCNNEPVTGAIFCNHCGHPLPVVCQQCTASNPLESRFCHRCGEALSSHDAPHRSSATRETQPTIGDLATDLKVLGGDLADYAWPRIKKTFVFIFQNTKSVAVNVARRSKTTGAGLARRAKASSSENDASETRLSPDGPSPSPPPIEQPRSIPHDAQSSVLPGADTACPRCRTVNQPGSLFCFNCGLPLDEVETAAVQTPTSIYASRPAGFWLRLAAWIIDAVILLVGQFTLIAAWPGIPEYFGSDSFLHWVDAPLIILTALYYTVGVSVWSTTVGKRILGMYVLRPDGAKVNPTRALARFFTSGISFLILGLGYLVIAFNRDKRAMHDVICDTVVVRK